MSICADKNLKLQELLLRVQKFLQYGSIFWCDNCYLPRE